METPKTKEGKVVLRQMYRWTGQNSCTCMGQYYGEDDWKVRAYAPTLEELRVKVICKLLAPESHGWAREPEPIRLSSSDLDLVWVAIINELPDTRWTVQPQ